MSDENLNISYDAKMFARANEVLRAEIDRLRAENERLLTEALIHERGRAEDARDNHGDMAALRAENEALRKDAERYRWLCAQNDWRYETYPGSPFACHWTNGLSKEQMGVAIDAARAREGER